MKKQEKIVTIPNILSTLRLILIPVFILVYYKCTSGDSLVAPGIILLAAGFTDFIDGKLARSLHQETMIGAILDPTADKLMQIAVMASLSFRFMLTRYVMYLLIAREVFMAITGYIMLRKGMKMEKPQWYGRFSTVFIFCTMMLLFFISDITYFQAGLIICFDIIVIAFSFICYIVFYIRMMVGVPNRRNTINPKKTAIIAGTLVVLFLAFEMISTLSVYSKQPGITDDMLMDVNDFYGDGLCGEYADIIEDNVDALFDRVMLINGAEDTIEMSTFDFRADKSGKIMLGALIDAANRGVEVKLLVDGINSWLQMEWNPYFYAASSCENIQIKVYNKANPLIPWKSIARMHDKYLIADDEVYILGGRNTYNRFLGDYTNYRNYDRDVIIYNDKSSDEASIYKLKDYAAEIWDDEACSLFHNEKYISDRYAVEKALDDINSEYTEYVNENAEKIAEYDYKTDLIAVDKVTLLSGSTYCGMKDPVIWANMCNLVNHAKYRARIHTPYIICNDTMYDSLRQFDSVNAQIMIMTNSIPNNDNPVGASEYLQHKDEILATKAKVWEFNGERSYHGKSIIIDDDISIVGSFNMDIRSAYLDTELMLVIDSKELNAELDGYMSYYEEQSMLALEDGSYYNPYNVTKTEFSTRRKRRMNLIRYFMSWARCFF